MTNEHFTCVEHFVPREYLIGFTSDGKMIYEHDLRGEIQIHNPVDIYKVCQKKHLYEYRDEKGEFVDRNYLERIMADMERPFKTFRSDVEKKAFIESNYSSTMFLTGREKKYIKAYITLQIMRSPQIIQSIEDEVRAEYGDALKPNEARSIALTDALPFFKNLPNEYGHLHRKIFSTIMNMDIAVGVDKADSIFTSDFPVCCEGSDNDDFRQCEKIIYPLTSSLLIILRGGKLKVPGEKNLLFPLDRKHLLDAKFSIASAANRWIYSKRPLSAEEKQIITMAHADKTQNENNQESI